MLGVLLEPTTVVVKALEQAHEVGHRGYWEPRTALVTGAGPIGLLAAMLLRMHALEVHVLDRVDSGPKPDAVRALGATYHAGAMTELGLEPDVVIECTGVGALITGAIQVAGPGGVVCLTGVGSGGRTGTGPSAADLGTDAVLKNKVIVGSVNANRRHWYRASEALARADRGWLARLLTRRERPEDFAAALERKAEDIKVVLQFSEA
jgi:threonine dehydrogenase-like Zn-dependent dehydrogenase